MANCTEKPEPLFISNVGGKRKAKLYRVAEIRGKSYAQMVRDWIDGLKEDKQ